MKVQPHTRCRPIVQWVWVALIVAGCGSNELESPTAKRMRGLAISYLEYAVAKNGAGPASEQVLRKHIANQPDFIVDMNGLDPKNIDAAFVSERDQEPLVVLYGTPVGSIGPKTPMVVHEKTGKNNRRLVAFADGRVELADEDRFKELTSSE